MALRLRVRTLESAYKSRQTSQRTTLSDRTLDTRPKDRDDGKESYAEVLSQRACRSRRNLQAPYRRCTSGHAAQPEARALWRDSSGAGRHHPAKALASFHRPAHGWAPPCSWFFRGSVLLLFFCFDPLM